MHKTDQRARAIQESIRRILIKDWDPIGIHDRQSMQDEYDAYVGGVYRLLAARATEAQITAHLSQIAQVRMGLSPNESHDAVVAEKLVALDVDLGIPIPP